jgi:hypothetical protein
VISVHPRKGYRSERAGITVLDSLDDILEELESFFIDQAEMSKIGGFEDDFAIFVQNDTVDADRPNVNPNIIIHKFDPSDRQHLRAGSGSPAQNSG